MNKNDFNDFIDADRLRHSNKKTDILRAVGVFERFLNSEQSLERQSNIHSYLAACHNRLNQYQEAIKHIEKSLEAVVDEGSYLLAEEVNLTAIDILDSILRSDNNEINRPAIHMQLAITFIRINAYDAAIGSIQEGLKIADKESVECCALKVLEAEITCYLDGKDNPELYYNIYEQFESHPNYFYVKALISLGNADYTKDGLTQLGWYHKAIEYADGHRNLLAQAYIGLGNARYTDDNHTQSDWFLKAIEYADDDNNLLAQAYIGLGNTNYRDNSLQWYRLAYDRVADAHYHPHEMQQHDSIKAQACIGLGDFGHTDIWVERSNLWYDRALDYLGDKGPDELRNRATLGLQIK